jgi:2-desacetyl-2-hydroxyethyl bacteriochlorophyllide A dehydrogenase
MVEEQKPELQEGHAIVKVKRIGICGTDLHAYRGRQPFFTYPRILGHELSGVIDEIAADDSGLRVGDKVCVMPYLHCGQCSACRRGKTNCCENIQVMGVHTDGGMREWISVPVSHLMQANELSFEGAAIVECLSIGAHAVRRARLSPQDKVLVIGAGPIGLGVMIAAVRHGARVVAMDMVEHRLEFCRGWAGVEAVLTGDGDVEAKLRQLLDGELPDIVFDATGNKASMERAFHYAAHGGSLIYVGLVRDDITFHDPLFHARELTLHASRNATKEDFEFVMQAIEDGAVDVDAFVTHQTPFERVACEFESWLDPTNNVIKAMAVLD